MLMKNKYHSFTQKHLAYEECVFFYCRVGSMPFNMNVYDTLLYHGSNYKA
jgi:hypothetical protein